jgi:hypothetical protein
MTTTVSLIMGSLASVRRAGRASASPSAAILAMLVAIPVMLCAILIAEATLGAGWVAR